MSTGLRDGNQVSGGGVLSGVHVSGTIQSEDVGEAWEPKLAEVLKRYGTAQAEATAEKLQQYAGKVLGTPVEHINTLQLSLSQHVKHLRCLDECVEQLEHEIAVSLAQTHGAFLSSIRGVGIVLAAGVTAELGNPFRQKPMNNVVSYSGIIPKVKQSGGSDSEGHSVGVSKRCNRILKDYVVKSAYHLGLHGAPDLMADYKRRDSAGQHADFGIGRRYVRAALAMMQTSQIYLPPRLREANCRAEERAGYYLEIWPYLRAKRKQYDALSVAFDSEQPLGQWRDIVQELYGIRLKL